MLRKVVLPAPFGPITQRIVPASIWKLMSSFAVNPRKRLVNPSVRSSSAMRCPRRAPPPPYPRHEPGKCPGESVFREHDHQDKHEAKRQLPILRRNRTQIVG